jgi:hypothetical protein
METKMVTAKEERQRKFLGWGPVIAFPVITLLFWGMGGGHGMAEGYGRAVVHGFNTHVPAAQVSKQAKLNKLDYYAEAAKDSVAARQKREIEENYAKVLGLGSPDSLRKPGADPAVRSVQEKLAELKQALAAPSARTRPAGVAATPTDERTPTLDRLEQLMGALHRKEAEGGGDPAIAQLSGMLDKLTAVQGPGRGRDTPSGVGVHPERRVTVTVVAVTDVSDTLGGADSTVIEAVSPSEQILVSGGQLRLELVGDISVGGHRIPGGTPVYGTVALSGERLRVTITAIGWQGRVYPVNLAVADADGGTGIYIPGAPASDAVRESAEEATGDIGPTVLSTTLAGQAAGAGVGLARSLIAKKVRPVKVTVPAGYRVFLHVQNQGL